MSEIPPDTVSYQDVIRWYQMKEELAKLKQNEMLLRQRIFRIMFVAPTEGTNTVQLSTLGVTDDHVLKAAHKISRTVDVAAYTALTPKFQEEKLPLGELVDWKPELRVGAYRKLTEEQRQLFDQALTIKPGSPELDVMLPKKGK